MRINWLPSISQHWMFTIKKVINKNLWFFYQKWAVESASFWELMWLHWNEYHRTILDLFFFRKHNQIFRVLLKKWVECLAEYVVEHTSRLGRSNRARHLQENKENMYHKEENGHLLGRNVYYLMSLTRGSPRYIIFKNKKIKFHSSSILSVNAMKTQRWQNNIN